MAEAVVDGVVTTDVEVDVTAVEIGLGKANAFGSVVFSGSEPVGCKGPLLSPGLKNFELLTMLAKLGRGPWFAPRLLGTFCTGLLIGIGGGLGMSDKGLDAFFDLFTFGESNLVRE